VSLGPLYIATERFDPAKGAQWDHYIAWSGLSQLREVVTLDAILCPRVIKEILPEDWNEIVNEDFMTDYFISLDYLMQRAGSLDGRNLLCVYRNPEAKPFFHDSRFQFEGYDLVDVRGGISALTNCGGFPLAFENGDLNRVGLLPALDRAEAVRKALTVRYPSHDHATCDVWAIFRMRQSRALP
jgi:hypothetical protein